MSNQKSKTGKQIAPTCVFCGGKPISEEHVWPNWFSSVEKKKGPDQTVLYHFSGNYADGYITKMYTRQGHPSRLTVRKFCTACNNGWMNLIEIKTRPILEKLILGESVSFTRPVKRQLATWASLRAVVYEYVSTSVKVISADRRSAFFRRKNQPLKKIIVWIGRADKAEGSYIQESTYGTISSSYYTQPKASNTKAITLVVGALVMHIVTFEQIYYPYELTGVLGQKMIRVWPLQIPFWARIRTSDEVTPLTIQERRSLLSNYGLHLQGLGLKVRVSELPR